MTFTLVQQFSGIYAAARRAIAKSRGRRQLTASERANLAVASGPPTALITASLGAHPLQGGR